MQSDSFIRVLAGSMAVLSALLTLFVHPYWVFLTLFVGINLIQSSFTGFCPPTLLLRKLGWIDQNGFIHWGGQKKG